MANSNRSSTPIRKTLSSVPISDIPNNPHPTPTPTATPIRKTLSSVPISDPEDRLFSRRLKSYSQPLPSSSSSSSSTFQHHLRKSHPSFQLHPTPSTHSPLPEFTGSGGGSGLFSLPRRAPLHPGRPPPIELRPHPFKETQLGCAIRGIASSGTHLWAALECGVRCWDLETVFMGSDKGKKGDEESAPYWEGKGEGKAVGVTTCLVMDEGRGIVWSGHKDGKIRSWRMDKDGGKKGGEDETTVGGSKRFKEGLSWNAHRTSVLSLVVTSCGELWSGHECGVIKAWPCGTIDKSLSLKTEERHIARLLIERSFLDLKNFVTVEGICPLPSLDVKHMLSDNYTSKVWSGSSQSFALWDSQKKELLKVFGINGQVESHVDPSPAQDHLPEDEVKVKLVLSTKKEKSHGSNFFQRSRNALLGAADAVRRVAAKSAFGYDYRKVAALTISVDGIIWIGCTNGSLIQWDGNGNRLQEFQHRSPVQSVCTHGDRIWIGYADGDIQVTDLEGNPLGGWVAHNSPVVRMAVGGSYIFTLASHGGIRGWYLSSPGPVDSILRSELTDKELLYFKLEKFKILAGTWNVGQEKASPVSLKTWLGCGVLEVDLVVIGLQEVEMGAGYFAMAAAKESVGLEGSANGQWWLDAIGKTLDEGVSFERVGSRQLAGLLIGVWAKKKLRPQIGDVDVAAVPCGLGRAIGNKGAVGVRMRVFDRKICFVNCHFAAHLEAVNKRNADFDHVYRSMTFGRVHLAGGVSSLQLHRGANACDISKPDLSEADMIVFLGDFNYRLRDISYDEARDLVSQRCFDWLREKDQLRAEMAEGKVFQGLREAHIKFPPTYKFDRHQTGLSGYDSGEKKRIPAWCDRILYRDSRPVTIAECSLSCPVVSSIIQYEACLEVTGSDHKPVRCMLTVDIARVDELTRRKQFGEIVSSNETVRMLVDEFRNVPETTVSTNEIDLPKQDMSLFSITNKCSKDVAVFVITCASHSTVNKGERSSDVRPSRPFGFPSWLKVVPVAGIIKSGQTTEIFLRHEDYHTHTLEDLIDEGSQNGCVEDNSEEVMLTVRITGRWSTESKCHKVCVRQCSSSAISESNSKLTRNQSRRH